MLRWIGALTLITTTLRLVTFSIATPSAMIHFVTQHINSILHLVSLCWLSHFYCYAKCLYDKIRTPHINNNTEPSAFMLIVMFLLLGRMPLWKIVSLGILTTLHLVLLCWLSRFLLSLGKSATVSISTKLSIYCCYVYCREFTVMLNVYENTRLSISTTLCIYAYCRIRWVPSCRVSLYRLSRRQWIVSINIRSISLLF